MKPLLNARRAPGTRSKTLTNGRKGTTGHKNKTSNQTLFQGTIIFPVEAWGSVPLIVLVSWALVVLIQFVSVLDRVFGALPVFNSAFGNLVI